MKSLISINHKFMVFNPEKLIEIIKNNSKYTKGFELSFDFNNNSHINYLQELANFCNKENLILQIHGNSSLNVENQIQCLKLLENISDILNYKINVVLHPLTKENKSQSIKATEDYILILNQNINHNKINLTLENLNDIDNNDRLNIEDIIPIVSNISNLSITYDIGHQIIENNNVILNKNISNMISNIHIHSNNFIYSNGFDHKPIFKDDKNWTQIIKSILFLKNINYSNNIVFEYDLYSCTGNNIEEKLISYCKSIDLISERF